MMAQCSQKNAPSLVRPNLRRARTPAVAALPTGSEDAQPAVNRRALLRNALALLPAVRPRQRLTVGSRLTRNTAQSLALPQAASAEDSAAADVASSRMSYSRFLVRQPAGSLTTLACGWQPKLTRARPLASCRSTWT